MLVNALTIRYKKVKIGTPVCLLGLSASVVALVARHGDCAGEDLVVVTVWAGQIFLSMGLG